MKWIKYSTAVAVGAVTVLSLVMLLTHSAYLQRVEEMSLFVPTAYYFNYCMELPGGLLTWAATFLTQFFYHPVLGSIIFALISAALTLLTAKAFRLEGFAAFLSVIPASMALLSFLSLGYIIFSLKTPGFAYTTMLGYMAVALIFWAYRSLPYAWLRCVAVVVAAMLYAAIGTYALFAVLLCAVHEIALWKKTKLTSTLTIVIALAAVVLWPRAWIAMSGGRAMLSALYTSILPRYHSDEATMWCPYIITALSMIVMSLIDTHKATKGKSGNIIYTAVGVASLVGVVTFSYRDANFNNTLAMKQAIDDQDWQKALAVAASATVEPTRLNCMLTEVALLHTGEAGDKLFAYPVGGAEYNTTRAERALYDAAAPLLCYHLGQVNLAYRWAMENKVEYDTRVEYLKILAKCALLNGEYQLARKYLTTLSQTMYHKPWAEKYMAYADNPELIKQDPEMAKVHYLMAYDDSLGVDSGGFELYLRPLIAKTTPKSEAALNLAMQNALVSKDLNTFVHWMPTFLDLHKPLPRHYQEAVMMWCYVNDSDAYKYAHVDESVVNAFSQFVEAYQRCQRMSPQEQRDYLRNGFGNTYWYYFAILDDIKVL